MSAVLDCSRSCLVDFPVGTNQFLGTDEIVAYLREFLPSDVSCIQLLQQSKARLSFEGVESASRLLETGLVLEGQTFPVLPADPRVRVVYVRDCPHEVSDDSVGEMLSPFGAVRKVSQVLHKGSPRISSGTRKVLMSVVKDIPLVLRVMGFDCRVWYAGQPAVCPICGKPGHRARKCPDHGKCRRCHRPGHIARFCRGAWVSSDADPEPTADSAAVAMDLEVAPVDQVDVELALRPSSGPQRVVSAASSAPSVSLGSSPVHADVPPHVPGVPEGTPPVLPGVQSQDPSLPMVMGDPSSDGDPIHAAFPSGPEPVVFVKSTVAAVVMEQPAERLPSRTRFAFVIRDAETRKRFRIDFGSNTRDVFRGRRSFEERRAYWYDHHPSHRPVVWEPAHQAVQLESREPSCFPT